MGILITAMLFACSIVGSIVVFGQEETPELKFLDAYMGGQSFSSDAAIPPVTTNYGTGIGLTFAANVYNLSANTASNGYAQELHDVDTNIADGDSGAVLKNKDLVIYDAAEGQDRTVSAIWYDLNGGIVFRFNEDQLAEDDSLVDPISGLQYIAYGDGDRVTVKKGFTFAYNDGSEEKELVLQNDVTVEYSAEEADWNEVIPEGGQSSFGGVYAEDVSITTGGGNYSMWGFTIDFFTDATRPAAFAGVVSGNTAAGSLKTVARITTGEAERAFFWDKNLVKYIEADGDVQDINMMYLNDKAQVCVRRADQSGVASASEGDKILLRKGFRVGYYYGQISDTVNNLGWTHYAAVQPVGVLMEDVLMVYRDGNWVHAQLAESAEFTTDISEIYKGQSVRLELSLSEGADELPVFSSSNPAAVSVDEDGVITGGDVSGTATITAIFSNTEATIEIANKTDVEVNGIEVSTIADYGKVILYQGKTPDKEDIVNQLQAYYLYANGFPGEAIALQADHIDLTGYDQGTIGDQTITVRVDGYSAAVPAEVFALPETVAPDYAKINNWGGALSINFAHLTADINAGVQQIDNAVLERLGVFDTVVLKNAEKEGGKAV